MTTLTASRALSQTQAWVKSFVLDLQLCPFAHAPAKQGQIHYHVSTAKTTDALLEDVLLILQRFQRDTRSQYETALLIHPWVLNDFFAYNDFLGLLDHVLDTWGLTGTLQIASFHPDYQFEGTAADDTENFTNRSPHPMLHFLREESVDRAVMQHTDIEGIPVRNIERLSELGKEAVQRRWQACLKSGTET